MVEKNYTISFTEPEIRLVLKALGRLPFSEVYETIEKIVRSTQAAPPTPSAVKKTPPKKSTRKK